jgi:multiple sugar transport system ATP-binding protein
MASVELRDIWKTFDGKTQVLKGVNLSVTDREFVTILGPSGCGKTTLLRIVAGLEHPDRGRVLIDGQDVSRVPPSNRDIAMVFQSYALYPHMTVSKNIAVSLQLRKIPKPEIEGQLRKVAKLLAIEDLLDRLPRALSGGQRQRVALARAIIRKPKVFLLDEPLSNLDAVLRDRTRSELKLLFSKIGNTVIYVTHDQVEAMTLSDRVVVLNEGVIQQIGTPPEIYNQPENTFVASFVGTPTMNLIHGRLDGSVFSTYSFLLRLDPDRLGRLQDYAGDVILGIRPEDVRVCGHRFEGAIVGRVSLSEPIGIHNVVSIEVGKILIRCVTQEAGFRFGSEVWILPDMAKTHIFDAATGKRLSPSEA